MIQMEVNEDLILKQKKALEDALASNPKTATKLRKMIREVILEERKKLVSSAEGAARRYARTSCGRRCLHGCRSVSDAPRCQYSGSEE